MSKSVCSISEKEKLEKETEKLKTEDLPIPRCVTSFYNKYCKNSLGRGYEYGDVISLHHGRMMQRIFCFTLYSMLFPATITECARRYEGGKFVVSNFYYGGMMQGYMVSDQKMRTTYDSGWNPETAYIANKTKASFTTPRFHLNEKQAIEKFGKYSGYEKYSGNLPFFDYLASYHKQPGIEYLVKAGYSNYVSSINFLNKNGKNFEEIFKVDKKWSEYLKGTNITELKLIRKYKWLKTGKEVTTLKNLISDIKYRDIKVDEKDYKYLTEKELKKDSENIFDVLSTYKDYLRFAKNLGYPLEEARYRYPVNLKAAHDDAESKFTVLKNKENDIKIKKFSKKAEKYSWSENEYCIFPVHKSEELINESKVLHHCVRTYINKVADGESMIYFVRHKDDPETPYVTLELIGKKITQVYGEHDTKPTDKTCEFVMDWKKKFRLTGWSYERKAEA